MDSALRTLKQATKDYMKIRSGLSKRKKKTLVGFEGQRFFRFGNSWRRLNRSTMTEVVLVDGENELRIQVV